MDPGIVACSFIASGLRVFDIRDPQHPREIAYFNPPGNPSTPYRALSAPTFAPSGTRFGTPTATTASSP
ncbi:MAG TPA: hypothetical protein VFF24_00420 [Acidimicrobiia bacterium]|nr:hypothetical protein [Acidimicrobiia bacterium]